MLLRQEFSILVFYMPSSDRVRIWS